MSTATITPLPGGTVIWSLNGVEHHFADVFAARRECEKRGIRAEVLPFPNPTVEVIAVSPALAAS